ncbi:lipid A export ATP-binding/permease protein MsbA [Aquipluma nitroreducens]|uniref:Lipid A export ATP-binding/permease protein MsbA n=1 Tax=Aquipluma nitroreducens TaxID=2010828 RepID=A0A5K7SGR8_9BACT|nr:ABC transporter ATP-binding protein [Aquipluma nitroreducens]BBE20627.1 lipid A export ATP-binding/permease protein MsbA [Aquipluma nitroreducens]
MNYNLNQTATAAEQKKSTLAALRKLLDLIREEKRTLILAFIIIFINAGLSLLGPYLIGHTIDTYIQSKQYDGVIRYSAILLVLYMVAFATNYLQMIMMGGVGIRMLYSLRNAVFTKLQELPVDFFNQNKAGDLISRINNDTDKLNQFFSQSLMQFISSIFTMLGAGIFLLSINLELGSAALLPALIIWIFTKAISPWVKRKNAANLKSTGGLSAEIQESLNNFKVIIAFNRRDYFRKRFDEANQKNYSTAVSAGLANNIFTPVFGFSSNLGQLVVLAFGIYLITTGSFTIGLLISFLAYVNSFYHPLRQLAGLWANFQVAMAGWDRISQILSLDTNLEVIENSISEPASSYLSFRDVSFTYPNGKEVLHHVNFNLERGKTYAFVGPTGGGKTTTASLIARLYDATTGTILLDGKDIRSYHPEERTNKIGFILQEPFLFTGTVRDNILYGNPEYKNLSNDELAAVIKESGLESLLSRFDSGLDSKVQTTGDGISLGQKQLIAFMRSVLRKPELLILDEATANIDTITEQLLENILQKLPATTTRVIIAHRLNTIENADEIFFVNSGEVVPAGSLADAVNLLLHGKRES